jgi:hypothetical protein
MKTQIKLLIIGAQKSGTTSLQKYIGQHPEICMNKNGDFPYFVSDTHYKIGFEKIYQQYFSCENHQMILAGKSVGIFYSPKALKRLYNYNPNIQIIILLRNPIYRAYSSYWYARRIGHENIKSFEIALKLNPNRFKNQLQKLDCDYLNGGLYYKHLKEVYKIFHENQIKIFIFENFIKNPLETCKLIFKNMGVSTSFNSNGFKRHNKAVMPKYSSISKILVSNNNILRFLTKKVPFKIRYPIQNKIRNLNERDFNKPPMEPKTKQFLSSYYDIHNEKLSESLGLNLNMWKI